MLASNLINNKRLLFIDLLKIIAVILIINSHMDAIYPISSLATGGAIGNAIFFFCSGYCVVDKKKDVKWVLKHVFKVYMPTEIVLIACYFIHKDNGNFFLTYIWPTSFWFVGAIVLYYLLSVCLDKLNIYSHFGWFSLFVAVIYCVYYVFLLDTSVWVIESTGFNIKGCFKLIYYFYAFCFGGFIKKINLQNRKLFNNKWLCLLGAFVSFVALYGSKFLMAKGMISYHFQFTNHVFTFAVALLLFLLASNISVLYRIDDSKIIYKIIIFMSGMSLQIYLTQFECIEFASCYSFPINFLTAICLIIICSLVLKFICYWIEKLIYMIIEKLSREKNEK